MSDSDFAEASKFKWCATKASSAFYAVRGSRVGERKKRVLIYLHRQILGAPKNKMVDHRNFNTLDNRRENLRLCDKYQNARNRNGAQASSRSGFRGLFQHPDTKRWHAGIKVKGKPVHLGYFLTRELAQAAYARANKKYFGAFGGVF